MKIEIYGYGLELHFYKTGYNKHFARQLLSRYYLNPVVNSPKIGLIKLLRMQQGITLSEAKEAIELMFTFENGEIVIR